MKLKINFKKTNYIKTYNINSLLKISNKVPIPAFELHDKTKVSEDELKKDILKNGMEEPFIYIKP